MFLIILKNTVKYTARLCRFIKDTASPVKDSCMNFTYRLTIDRIIGYDYWHGVASAFVGSFAITYQEEILKYTLSQLKEGFMNMDIQSLKNFFLYRLILSCGNFVTNIFHIVFPHDVAVIRNLLLEGDWAGLGIFTFCIFLLYSVTSFLIFGFVSGLFRHSIPLWEYKAWDLEDLLIPVTDQARKDMLDEDLPNKLSWLKKVLWIFVYIAEEWELEYYYEGNTPAYLRSVFDIREERNRIKREQDNSLENFKFSNPKNIPCDVYPVALRKHYKFPEQFDDNCKQFIEASAHIDQEEEGAITPAQKALRNNNIKDLGKTQTNK
jgi:hypothetical protein